eukprot:3880241-Pyramimonas_sp.AAC.1
MSGMQALRRQVRTRRGPTVRSAREQWPVGVYSGPHLPPSLAQGSVDPILLKDHTSEIISSTRTKQCRMSIASQGPTGGRTPAL